MTPTSTQVYLEHHDGRWRCIRTPDGRATVRIGCSHLSPAHASAHARAMTAARDVSPLRDPAEPSDPRCAPLTSGLVEGSAGAPSKAASPGSRNAGQ